MKLKTLRKRSDFFKMLPRLQEKKSKCQIWSTVQNIYPNHFQGFYVIKYGDRQAERRLSALAIRQD